MRYIKLIRPRMYQRPIVRRVIGCSMLRFHFPRRGSSRPRCSLNLSRGFDAGALILHQPIHRRVDATLLVRHIGKRETHLDSGSGAEDSQVVGVAEMTDAEDL